MKSIAVLLSLVISSLWAPLPVQAAERNVAQLGAEFWFMPRHGEQLLAQDSLKVAVQRLSAEPEARLVLHHPATEAGELWGRELQAWLVSLGIVSDRIELRDGYEGEGVAVILVTPDIAEPAGESVSVSESTAGASVDGGVDEGVSGEQSVEGENSAEAPPGEPATVENKSEVEPQ